MKRFLLSLFIILLFYLPCYISNDLLIDLTQEDGPYEYTGAIFFLFTAGVYFILAIYPKRYNDHSKENRRITRVYFSILALVFVFAFGEEISWGQRIFNFATPEAIKDINLQQEFNFHNLEIFHGKTADGEEKKGILALLTLHKIFYLSFLFYLLFIPILYKTNARVRTLIKRIHLPIPQIIFGLLFIFNLFYDNILRAIFSDLDGHGIVEIKEVVIALILLAFSVSLMQNKPKEINRT